MFYKSEIDKNKNEVIRVGGLGHYSLKDTFECGQCFRYEVIEEKQGYAEYMTVVGELIIRVAQERPGELIFYGMSEEDFIRIAIPYFSLETDYEKIREDIVKRSDSEWLKKASECAKGIAILKQDPWETVFSFIISQNNNIPRIRKIIKKISAEYGVNICLQNNVKTS